MAARILAAHQANYLPWLGYLHKAAQADVFVLADDVQYTSHGFVNRNKVRTAQGWQWLTVPVRTKGRAGQAIRDVEIDVEQPWARKHLNSFAWCYAQAPFWSQIGPFLEDLYANAPARLLDLNMAHLRRLFEGFGVDASIHLSSEFDVRDGRSERLVDLARACDCDVYLAGEGASRDYLDIALFDDAGIEVRFTEFRHPRYPQCHPGFEAGMCAYDLLLNCGPRSREVLFG